MHNLELNTKDQILNLVYSYGPNKMASIQFHEDASHGWLQVPKKLLAQLGILNKITPYSYEDNIYAYLEEDCDLDTFFMAMRNKGYTVNMININVPDFDSYLANQ